MVSVLMNFVLFVFLHVCVVYWQIGRKLSFSFYCFGLDFCFGRITGIDSPQFSWEGYGLVNDMDFSEHSQFSP